MRNTLAGDTVVVIGGSKGIGAAVAAEAQSRGARVITLSRSGKGPGDVEKIAVDATDAVALADALGKVGAIDHLVHTASARTETPALHEVTIDVLMAAYGAKLFAAVQAIRLALPYLSPSASITLTSGQVSRRYGKGTLAKGIVNAGVDTAARHLAKELAPIRVNVVSPGLTDTELWGAMGSEARESMLARAAANLPVGRAGSPDDLAEAYLFAMSSQFMTGAVLDVDGGGLL